MKAGTGIADTLVAVADRMSLATDPWWIIAGAAAALHGVDGPVADVDVLLSRGDFARLLRSDGIRLVDATVHPRFRSGSFARWRDNPLPVEFMADFAVRVGEEWEPVWPATRRWIAVADSLLPVPERNELAAMFRRFGRAKDLDRARLLDR